MKIVLDLLETVDELITLEHPLEFFGENLLNQRKFGINLQGGDLEYDETWFENATIIFAENTAQHRVAIKMSADNPQLFVCFCLQGELCLINSKAKGSKKCLKGQILVNSYSSLEIAIELKVESSTCILSLGKRFVQHYMLSDSVNPFDRTKTRPLNVDGDLCSTSAKILLLIAEMQSASQPGHIRKLLLEAKILEILAIHAERIDTLETPSDLSLSEEDLKKLRNARDLVEADIQTPCSLVELSRRTGLNDYKLKKGFKAVFGNTVFGYLAELRMSTAYELLQKGCNVNEVSERVGYKNPHHFTAAFKKRFRVLPSHLKKG